MLVIVGCVVVGLVAGNLWTLRELRRLRRRTRRLAILARDEARRVRSMDRATATAFAHVQSILSATPAAPDPDADPDPLAAPAKPTFLN